MEYVVTTRHADATLTRVWFGYDSAAAHTYWREHIRAVMAAGGRMSVGINTRLPEGRTHCPICHGSGLVLTRMTVTDGCGFPDEDACPRCGGAGHLAPTVSDITATAAA